MMNVCEWFDMPDIAGDLFILIRIAERYVYELILVLSDFHTAAIQSESNMAGFSSLFSTILPLTFVYFILCEFYIPFYKR